MEPTENDTEAAGAPSALNVGLGVIFALFNSGGILITCSTSLDGATRTLNNDMPKKMWNALFSEDSPVERANIYRDYGWTVKQGTFTPNATELTGCEAVRVE